MSEVLGTMFDTGVETTDVYAKQDGCRRSRRCFVQAPHKSYSVEYKLFSYTTTPQYSCSPPSSGLRKAAQ